MVTERRAVTDGHPAQTNLQLYNQLVHLSWSDQDLTRARAAYELADRLFAGTHRSSGKPFIAHLVGTASVVADVDGRAEVVLAALLHSVYTRGGTAISSRAPRRSTVRSVIGTGAEELVFRYTTTPWNPAAFDDAVDNLDQFDRTRSDVLLLRLANEVDEHADLGTRYYDKGVFLRDGNDALARMAALAERLARPKLAATFRLLLEEERDATVPRVLLASTPTAQVSLSGSYAARLSSSARTAAARGRRLAVSLPGARSAVHALRRLKLRSRSLAGGR